tara:strand:- start:429 stop:698 length:270 start_codon:yes stop_codon:yes gene_type:complete
MVMNKNPARDPRALKRIRKEHEKMMQDDDGTLQIEVVSDSRWNVHFLGASGTVFENENFSLRVEFTNEYPMVSRRLRVRLFSTSMGVCV